MNRLAIFVLFFSLPIIGFSQTIDTAFARIFYLLKHKQDLPQNDSIYVENMVLLIGKKASAFSSYDKLLQATAVSKNIEEQKKNWTGAGLPRTIMPGNLKRISTQEIFFLYQKTTMTSEYLLINYLYEEPLDQLPWVLVHERKKIDGIECQKASAKYRGRDWTAWFAPDIPSETGPWRLHGLPGLILEAYDNNKDIQFLFNGFENLNSKQNDVVLIKLPNNAVKTTFSEINRLKGRMHKDPKGFSNAQTQMSRGIIDPRDFAGFSAKKIINPIDLTEVK